MTKRQSYSILCILWKNVYNHEWYFCFFFKCYKMFWKQLHIYLFCKQIQKYSDPVKQRPPVPLSIVLLLCKVKVLSPNITVLVCHIANVLLAVYKSFSLSTWYIAINMIYHDIFGIRFVKITHKNIYLPNKYRDIQTQSNRGHLHLCQSFYCCARSRFWVWIYLYLFAI